MTILVGVLCRDGVVIASDSAMTFGLANGQPTIRHLARKVDVVSSQAIVATTGQVGLGQRFSASVEELCATGMLECDGAECMRRIAAKARANFASTGVREGQLGALVAITPPGQPPTLCEFAVADLQPELKTVERCWYVSMGSGQAIADPFLAVVSHAFWSSGPPDVRGGTFAAMWVMRHAIRCAPGMVADPIDVAVLDRAGARLLDEGALQEHHELVLEADRHMAAFGDRFSDAREQPLPKMPL